MPFTLPALPYAYNALEPHFDAQTMEIHHSKHHQAYITNLNTALQGTSHEATSVEDLLTNISTLAPAVRNNGGGHYNHSFFWESLSGSTSVASEALQNAINNDLGGMEKLKEEFSKACLTRFGSGWGWLGVKEGKLVISSTPNQDNPLMDVADVKSSPILGLDVWEHAYYLKYQNRRADFVAAFWNVVNWAIVSSRYEAASK
jgi:superoxide dismutase, Fe-Mn family